jgi:hypothetical protein
MTIPFGKHKNQPLVLVPTGYLDWIIRACKLPSGLRGAIADELTRRGMTPPPPPARPVPECPSCDPLTGYRAVHERDSLDRPRIRAVCAGCGRYLAFLPLTPGHTASRGACPTPIT